jgi:hypothetical protein
MDSETIHEMSTKLADMTNDSNYRVLVIMLGVIAAELADLNVQLSKLNEKFDMTPAKSRLTEVVPG